MWIDKKNDEKRRKNLNLNNGFESEKHVEKVQAYGRLPFMYSFINFYF